MTVSSCLTDFSVYNKDLWQFLLTQKRACLKNHCAQIASISLEINPVDPLVVLNQLTQPNQLNFYWQNKTNKEAIAAIDAVAKLEVTGKERFSKSEEFIKKCLNRTVCFARTSDFSGTRFFCSFSFFDNNLQEDYPFPAATIFLPRWQVLVKNDIYLLVANIMVDASINIQNILQILDKKVQQINSLGFFSPSLDRSPSKFSKQTVANPEKFKRSVRLALESIRSEHLRKVVLADVLDVESSSHFDLFATLSNLRKLHPNCYVFSIGNERGQHFIGASPERLISISNQQLVTDALAGSAPRGQTHTEDVANANRLLNSEKERHEHLLVIDFITKRLLHLGLLPQVLPPRLRQLSNIQHLWTPINAVVPSKVHPLKIVAQLHPTPAVAGASRDIACEEIRCYESFERGLYAAPLGWVDSQGNCEFIVGIRSALINGDRARLYAGAGIVAGSDPEKELIEIQIKLQALLKALV